MPEPKKHQRSLRRMRKLLRENRSMNKPMNKSAESIRACTTSIA